VGYVRAQYPRRFWNQQVSNRDSIVAAALLRMADQLETLMVLLPARRDLDAAVLVRSMYELMVRLCWVLIDPDERIEMWQTYTMVERLKQHRQLAAYGAELFRTEKELEEAEWVKSNRENMPTAETMAKAVDRHWSTNVRGFHPSEHSLSIGGLYQFVYRTSSGQVHGSVDALNSYVDVSSSPPMIHVSNEDRMIEYVLGAPLLGMALVVAGEVVDWIDVQRVRRFVDRASGETIRRRERAGSTGPTATRPPPAIGCSTGPHSISMLGSTTPQ
jgi:hypothetical protein